MLKNPAKATRFYSDSRDKHPPQSPLTKGGLRGVLCILKKGWLASLKGYKASLARIFHHICLTN